MDFLTSDEFEDPLDEKEPASTYLVKHIATGGRFVAKRVGVVKKKDDSTSTELSNAQSVESKYLVKLEDTFLDKLDRFVVMEYCEGGDLRRFLNKKKEKGWKPCECVCILLFKFK
jgi:serine/threonine protein kinase